MLQEAFKKLKGVPAQSAREVMINQAMRLAYFIHRDQELAAHITTEALIKLNAAAVAQDRRYLYEPGGRASQGIRARNKIMLSELHLLQRILFHESEPYERQTELYFQTKPDQRRMIVHYLKHLVSVTLKRNSFYTTLGITRLLCRYTTAEAMDIYNLVVQDPARVKDDYYWRSRKGHLMQDMRERFGPFLQSSRGTRGEERFVARADASSYLTLVKECLEMFMPWKTICPLPADSALTNREINTLMFRGSDPDEEHRIELARMHTVLHPGCFDRLLTALSLPSFVQRLELPHFFATQNQDRKPATTESRHSISGPGRSSGPHQIDFAAIERRVSQSNQERRRATPNRLRILVDGRERALLDLDRERQARFAVQEGAEMIEVRTTPDAGDILLAAHMLSYDELQQSKPATTFVTPLGRGRKIAFQITAADAVGVEPAGALVEVGYRVTGLSAVWQWSHSVFAKLAPTQILGELAFFRYALPTLFLALTIAGGLWLYSSRTVDQQSDVAVNNSPNPASTQTVAIAPTGNQAPDSTTPPPASNLGAEKRLGGRNTLPSAPSNVTRDSETTTANTSLAAVSKIYLELEEGQSLDPALREQLQKRLSASGRWTITNMDEADAALMILPSSVGNGITCQLVNENGQTLWRGKSVYRGTADKIAAQIVTQLLAATRRSLPANEQEK